MKARIPLNSKIKREIKNEVKRYSLDVQNKMAYTLTRRNIKVMLYTCNKHLGFGSQRLWKLFNAFTETLNGSKDDEVFWEHIDRVLIDEYKIPFERDYTENGRAVSYDEFEINTKNSHKL